MDFGAQLVGAYLWVDYELGESRVCGYHADGYVLLEQRTVLEYSIGRRHNGSGGESTVFHSSLEKDEVY